jgi:hypothetical protein
MAIQVKDLDRAIEEAKQFLESARVLQAIGEVYPIKGARPHFTNNPVYIGGPLPARVKRMSMELSHTLAALRKGDTRGG